MKFGEESGGWCSCNVRGTYGIGVWMKIRMEWEIFIPNILCSLGNDRRVCIWKDTL